MCQIYRGNVENETHFSAECPLYLTIRSKYLGSNVETRIVEILQSEEKENAYNLANYLTKATELREYMLKMREYFIWSRFVRVPLGWEWGNDFHRFLTGVYIYIYIYIYFMLCWDLDRKWNYLLYNENVIFLC